MPCHQDCEDMYEIKNKKNLDGLVSGFIYVLRIVIFKSASQVSSTFSFCSFSKKNKKTFLFLLDGKVINHYKSIS